CGVGNYWRLVFGVPIEAVHRDVATAADEDGGIISRLVADFSGDGRAKRGATHAAIAVQLLNDLRVNARHREFIDAFKPVVLGAFYAIRSDAQSYDIICNRRINAGNQLKDIRIGSV